ncbi:MAG: TolC family protein [Opitutales bacterium]|nr:TolC family protein [Opitutales bacterium]
MTKKLLAALALTPLLIFSACETVRQAREVQQQDIEKRLHGERTVHFSEFEVFGKTLNLEALEAIALEANPKIFQARQAVIIAQLAVKDIRADYYPTVDASASYLRQTNNVSRHGQSGHSAGTTRMGLELDLLVYDFGKTDAKLQRAVAQLLAAEQELVLAENQIRFNVRKAYFELRRAVELNEVALQSVEQYRKHAEQMNSRYEAGKGTKYDCTKAEVDYNNAVLANISTANTVKTARAKLNLELGLAESPEFELGPGKLKVFPEDVEELMKIAREREPGFAVLRAQEAAASAYLDKTIADLYPNLGISVSAALTGNNLDMPHVWNIVGAGTAVQNIFNGGRNMRAIENAVAQLRIARSKVAEYEQSLFAKLTEAELILSRSRKQTDVAKLSQKAAAQNLDIVTEQFNVGKASSLDRTDAQVSLTEASAALVSAQYDYLDALAQVALLIGE